MSEDPKVQTFKLDTSNYIGFKYEKYLNEMRSMALTEPTKYAKLRNEAIDKLSDAVSRDFYNRTYEILTNGVYNGVTVSDTKPQYPGPKLAELALSHTQTIVDMMDEIVDLLFPEKFLATANAQLEFKRKANNIE